MLHAKSEVTFLTQAFGGIKSDTEVCVKDCNLMTMRRHKHFAIVSMRYFEGTLYTSQESRGKDTFSLLTYLAVEALSNKAKTQTCYTYSF